MAMGWIRHGIFMLCCGALLTVSPMALADWVWAESGPLGREDLQAVAIDPQDPHVVWAADTSGVWVTDDAGESWQAVVQIVPPSLLQMPPFLPGLDGDQRNGARDDGDGFNAAPMSADDVQDSEDSSSRSSLSSMRSSATGSSLRRQSSNAVLIREAKTIRLRVIDDDVYLCTGRGLWAVARSARALGAERRIRFGRQSAVFDITKSPNGTIFLATANGLRTLTPDGASYPVSGALGRMPVVTLLALSHRVLAATKGGLWWGDVEGFSRLSLTGSQGIVVDLVRDPLTDHRVAAATGSKVLLLSLLPQAPAEVQEIWMVPGATRLAWSSSGELWAAGAFGVSSWSGKGDDDWRLKNAGLRDRNITALAAPAKGHAKIWFSGGGGLFRRVPERERL